MSGFVPNPRQEEVLAFPGNLVVLAGAGSGKTGALIELLIRLLAGEVPGRPEPLTVNSLLALTFAEKAAAEMRERLRRKIEERLARASEPGQRRHWLAAYHQLDRSDIGTIHGFALKLLRRKALFAGTPARLSPQSDPWLLERLRMDLLLDYVAQGRPELRELLFWLPLRGGARGEGLAEWLRALVERQGSFGLGFKVEDAETAPAGELESLAGALAELEALLSGPAIKKDAKYRPALEKVRDGLGAELAEPAHAFERSVHWLQMVERSGNWCNRQAQALKKSLIGHLKRLAAKRAARLLNPLKAGIAGLGTLFYQDLDERLSRQGQLTFDAMLLKARKLLAQNPGLRAELAAAYPVILVDEFQDTNQVQADLLAYLALPPEDGQVYPEDYPAWSRLAKEAGRLMVFGDPKQSIYRFRGAESGLMADFLKTAVAAAENASPEARLVALDCNYRSQAGLIEFYNDFFEPYLGREQFSPNDRQTWHRARLYEGPQAVWLPWEAEGLKPRQRRLREMELLVGYLKELLSPKTQVRLGPEGRRPRFEDITVLLRRFTRVAEWAAALRTAGLPVRVVRGFGPLETGEVRAVAAAYACLAGLDRELHLAALMRSPLAGVSDQAVAELVYGPGGCLSSYFENSRPDWPRSLSSEDVAALETLKRLLAGLKPLMHSLEPAAIMALLVERSGLRAVAGAAEEGPAKLAALERFLALARRLPAEAAAGPLTAADYFLTRLKEPPEREDEPPEENETSIVIMTIHQAKGLGFPIVVVPETGARRNHAARKLIFGDGGRLALRLDDPVTKTSLCPLDYEELRNQEDEKSLNDYKRLLYVAATRAKDHLVFLGPAPAGQQAGGDSWHAALARMAEKRPDLLKTLKPCERPENGHIGRPGQAPDPAALKWVGPVSERLGRRREIRPRAFSLSVTSLALALSCPRAYYYQEVLGLKPFFEPYGPAVQAGAAGETELSPAQKGRIFHGLLETWPLAASLAPAELVAEVMAQACGRLHLRPSPGEETYLRARALEFWGHPCGRELLAAAAAGLFIDRECPLWLELEAGGYQYSLTGMIDLYYQSPEGPWKLLDYKLAWPRHIGRYGRQLEIYALALRRAFQDETALLGGLYFAGSSPARYEPVPLRATERIMADLAGLGDWLARLSAGDLEPPAIASMCPDQDCPFKNNCSA